MYCINHAQRWNNWAGNRVKGGELETVNPQALEGVTDAMKVSNLTQASLLHTIRERYNRDEVSRTVNIFFFSPPALVYFIQ